MSYLGRLSGGASHNSMPKAVFPPVGGGSARAQRQTGRPFGQGMQACLRCPRRHGAPQAVACNKFTPSARPAPRRQYDLWLKILKNKGDLKTRCYRKQSQCLSSCLCCCASYAALLLLLSVLPAVPVKLSKSSKSETACFGSSIPMIPKNRLAT